MAKAIFVGGTASHAGKSWMTAAICRYLYRRGLRVAPFKAQNMSNNSFPCATGGEIGRAQVAQAEACGIEPTTDMNPILLKPSADTRSQVVLNGRIWRSLPAASYYQQFDFLLGQVLDAYERLSRAYEVIVIEGAGSMAELNLRGTDLVNFGLATRINAPVLLVGDIDRGGIFASLIGTVELVEPAERDLIRALAVNKFRGDINLFLNGVEMIEKRTGKPNLGVFPYARDIHLDEEDGVSLERAHKGPSDMAIVALPRISNLTDFRLLQDARWIRHPVPGFYEWIFLPGTKSTAEDLAWLRSTGLADWLLAQHEAGANIVGICGGYQMLGESVEDPYAVESANAFVAGLGLLPIRTVMAREKATIAVEAQTPGGAVFRAYEIHMGRTTTPPGAQPFASVNGLPEGLRHRRCIGTYLHGALEDAAVLSELLGRPIEPPPPREESYDRLGEWFAAHADIKRFEELFLG
ncbi:MAG: cobyric acid synthase [Acidobacteria bacterium]|nr:cobyric acid synthase [Acidobacteriota bacterium]